jgi:hypothetical protein
VSLLILSHFPLLVGVLTLRLLKEFEVIDLAVLPKRLSRITSLALVAGPFDLCKLFFGISHLHAPNIEFC